MALGSLFLLVLGSKITLLMAATYSAVQDSLRSLMSLRRAESEYNYTEMFEMAVEVQFELRFIESVIVCWLRLS